MKKIKFGRWYCEYRHSNIRIHDYFSLMINMFPILVIRKYDSPHVRDLIYDYNITVGILGFSIEFIKHKQKQILLQK